MGMYLWKTTESKCFGNCTLIDFLEAHGAENRDKAVMDVPASAFRAALAHPKEAGLSEKDIAFIKNEIKDIPEEAIKEADDAGDNEFEEEIVDTYDLA